MVLQLRDIKEKLQLLEIWKSVTFWRLGKQLANENLIL